MGITTLTGHGRQWSNGAQYFIDNGRIIGSSNDRDSALDAWLFPHGCAPVQQFGKPTGGAWWYGVTVSDRLRR